MVGLQYLKSCANWSWSQVEFFVSSMFDKPSDSRPGEIMVHPSCIFSATGSPGSPILGFVISWLLYTVLHQMIHLGGHSQFAL